MVAERSRVLWHRLRANHLVERLPAGSLAAAAFAGLQDSAPRAALVALHARVDGVTADAWEHPSLAQIWAPRGAVFVVPRKDLAVFARGIMPRSPALQGPLEELAQRARASVTEPRVKSNEEERLGPIPAELASQMRRQPIWRLAFAVAGIEVRWNARRTELLPSPRLEVDDEQARRELARRFLRSLGPAGPRRFQRWAAVSEDDAGQTFDAIADELVPTRWPDGEGFVLADDAKRLETAEPVSGVRFLPFGGDPVLQPGEDVVAAERSHRRDALPPWASTGLVLLDGEVAAAWGRSQDRVTVYPLAQLDSTQEGRIEAEATALPVPAPAMRVTWGR